MLKRIKKYLIKKWLLPTIQLEPPLMSEKEYVEIKTLGAEVFVDANDAKTIPRAVIEKEAVRKLAKELIEFADLKWTKDEFATNIKCRATISVVAKTNREVDS